MPFLGTISSPDNQTLKYARSVRDKKRVRYRDKRYLIEGLRAVAHALDRGVQPAFVFCTADLAASTAGQELLARLSEVDAPAWSLAPALLATITDTVTPQGIAALLPIPSVEAAMALEADLLLVLDEVRDPGNLGTILRTAQAAAVGAVLLTKGCVDAYAPKVVRAAMGAHLHLPIFSDLEWPAIRGLVEGKRCVLADVAGEMTLWDLDWTAPTALLMGGEASGAGAEARALAAHRVRLPMAAEVESLNVAIATALLLYEAQRQRHLRPNHAPQPQQEG